MDEQKEKIKLNDWQINLLHIENVLKVKKDLEKLGLNERQIKAVDYVVKRGSITNKVYQKLNNTTKRTASRDLAALVQRGILRITGKGKRELRYVMVLGQNVPKMSQKIWTVKMNKKIEQNTRKDIETWVREGRGTTKI